MWRTLRVRHIFLGLSYLFRPPTYRDFIDFLYVKANICQENLWLIRLFQLFLDKVH
jgi:hypothetical protein